MLKRALSAALRPASAALLLLVSATMLIWPVAGAAQVAPPTPPSQAIAPANQFDTYDNYQVLGAPLKGIKTIAAPDCQSLCAASHDCHAIAFAKWTKFCLLLKSATGLRFDPRFASSLPAGITLPPESDTPFVSECAVGHGFAGSVITEGTKASLPLCEASCTETEACVGFTFAAATNTCRLYGSLDSYSATNGLIAGLKRQLKSETDSDRSAPCTEELGHLSATPPQLDPDLAAKHRDCVITAFFADLKSSDTFDPDLAQIAIGRCETLLAPLARILLEQSHDTNFKDRMLSRIRENSRKALLAQTLAYLQKQ
jgi:hypothetical protein